MSQVPPPYNRSFSFTDFSTYNPSLQQPGNKIDQELNNIRVSVNQTIDRLSEIQLDDGRLDSTSLNFNAILTGLSPALSLTYATLNSPVFTGSPEAPTPNQYDNSTKIATTSFVKNQNYATQDQLTSLQSSLSGYLTLSGGTLGGNLIIDAGEGSSGHFESTEVYVTRNDATGTSANAYGALYNGGLSVGDATGKYAELTPDYIRFGDGSTQASAASGGGTWGSITGTLSSQTDLYDALNGKLSLTGGIMSGAIRFDSVGTQNIAKGSFDAGRGGYNGISLVCAVDYELNWQAGYLKALNSGGAVVPINLESNLLYSEYGEEGLQSKCELSLGGLNVFNDYGNTNLTLNPYGFNVSTDRGVSLNINVDTGITFPDSTTQNTAGLPLTGGTVTGVTTFNDTVTLNTVIGDIFFDAPDSIGVNDTPFNFNKGGSVISITGEGITYPDSSVQTTAFPPTGGTSSQYINGTGALTTFPPLGDRYLTTSTSTLTIDNGNGKTMTVETGLSYSAQQDITVSYDASHHIHGTIVSYNPTTGVMVFDANSHTGTGTYSNWEVNVGGVNGAILPVDGTAGQVLAKVDSSNFSTEWISLGTMSTEPASAYLSTASAVANYQTISGMSAYLSTSAAASTYQTQSAMSAYLSTSAASSTYLTQSNASSTYLTQSSASANFIGTSAYATTAQAEAMTSATTVLSPARFRDAYFTANVSKPNTSTWLTGTSGTGGLNDSGTWDFRRLEGPTSAANTYVRCDHGTNFGKGRNFNGNIDWTKYNALYFRITQYAGADANSIFRAVLGEASGTNTGDPTVRSVGIRFNGTGAIKILAHNGTTLTTYTTSTSLTTSSSTDILIVSDGSGTVEVFANGTSIGTTTGGPTTLLAGTAQQSGINYRIENNNTPSGTQVKTIISGTTAYIS